ncbi:MAG: hypothetical protein BWK79_18925 [Beggiatoa sp. IS2]|nr:MAG: hypothetical protein BWK79_18925 [Beggiatoa sp. IS2]
MFIELLIFGGAVTLWQGLKGTSAHPIMSEPTKHATQVFKDLKTAIFGDERQQMQSNLNSERKSEIGTRKNKENQKIILAAGATGLAIFGTVSPFFYLVGSGAVIYLGRHVLKMIYQDFKQNHFITVHLISAILMFGMIATGQLVLATLAGLIGGFLVKLIKQVEDNSQQQLINVFSGHPRHVWLEKDGVELEIAFETLQKGDIIVVHAGEIIPADGVIHLGSASIDQRILTGESQPIEKIIGDQVFAATLVLTGRIRILVTTAGEETLAANIGQVLNNTQNYKDTLMLRGKKIADGLLPIELGIGATTYLLFGAVPAIATLWSGLGYRMIILGPISVLNYLQILSRQGILVKDGRILESLRQVDTVVFDKTGTLTLEQPTVGKIHRCADYNEREILYYAASAEYRQTHPIAKAILDAARDQQIQLDVPETTYCEVGYGLKICLSQKTVLVGSMRFIQREGIVLSQFLEQLQQQAEEFGHSLLYVSIDQAVVGVLEIEPTLRPEAAELIKQLHQRNITTYIISGDHEQPTRNIAQQLGIQHYFAETLPEHKANLINQLKDEGRFVCFIGDGINDAIALKASQISISLKGASSAATDTAQIIFMDGTLAPLSYLFKIVDEFENTMKNNFLLSVVPGVLNVSGVYLLNFSISTSMGLFYMGTIAGLVSAILPLLKH